VRDEGIVFGDKKGDRLLFREAERSSRVPRNRTLTDALMRYLSRLPFPDSVPVSEGAASERI